MARVKNGFVAYHSAHCERIAWIVAPLMGLEALTSVVLLAVRPPTVSATWAWVGVALVGLIWLATALFSVPEHSRLQRSFDAAAIERLVRTNWIRTLAWTARGALVLWLAAQWTAAGRAT